MFKILFKNDKLVYVYAAAKHQYLCNAATTYPTISLV